MTKATDRFNNGQQASRDFNTAKVFLGNNRYQKDQYTNNSTYDPITLYVGTVMGRITASGAVVPLQSTANDGSQFPVGILANEILVIDSGDQVRLTLVDMGDVAQDQLIFVKPGDGLETAVSSKRIKDYLAAQGIKLLPMTDMSGYDTGN